jgi:hypothetical protein
MLGSSSLRVFGRRGVVFAAEDVERDRGSFADDPAVVAWRDREEVAAFIRRSVPSSSLATAWPLSTRPTCSTWQEAVPTVAAMCLDQRQPGS